MKRNLTLDILRLILACFVIGIHTGFGKDASPEFRYVLFNGLFKVAVPTFLVINGFFFYKNVVVGEKPFRVWRGRLIQIYIVWSLIYLPVYWPQTDSLTNIIIELGSSLIFGALHLWYIVATLGAGILTYWLLRSSSTLIMSLTATCAYVTGLFLQYFISLHNPLNSANLLAQFADAGLYRNFLFFGLPFFPMGYLLAKHDAIEKIYSKAGLIATTLIAVAALLVESLVNFKLLRNHEISLEFMFALPFASAMLFIAAQKLHRSGASDALANLSTGIYFLHPLILLAVFPWFTGANATLTIIVALLAAGTSWVLMQNGFARKILF